MFFAFMIYAMSIVPPTDTTVYSLSGKKGQDGKVVCSVKYCWSTPIGEVCGEKITIKVKCPTVSKI